MYHLMRRVLVVATWTFALGALFLSPAVFGSGDCEIPCEECEVDLVAGTVKCNSCTIGE